jgi:hypothetical protein
MKDAADKEGDTFRDGGLLTASTGAVVASWLLVGTCKEGDYYVMDATEASGRGSYGGYRILTRVHYEQADVSFPSRCSGTLSIPYTLTFGRRVQDITVPFPGNPDRTVTLDVQPLTKLGEMDLEVTAVMENHCGEGVTFKAAWEVRDAEGALVGSGGTAGSASLDGCKGLREVLFARFTDTLEDEEGAVAEALEQLEDEDKVGDLLGGSAASLTGALTKPAWGGLFDDDLCLLDLRLWCEECCRRTGPGPGGFIDVPAPGQFEPGDLLDP